jgi:hypothetical protein
LAPVSASASSGAGGGIVGLSRSHNRKARPRISMAMPVHRLMLMSCAFFRSASEAKMPAIVMITP